jgi:hypothetical protein
LDGTAMDHFTFNNENVQNLLEKLKKKDGHIDEEKCQRIINQLKNEEAVVPLRDEIRKEYLNYLKDTVIDGCSESSWLEGVSFFPRALQKACYDIEADIRILFSRRRNLIGTDKETGISRISIGKIAGVTTYRLAKAHIIHLNQTCIDCFQNKFEKKEKLCSISTFNAELAIICGLYFIGKNYTDTNSDVRNEILYTLINRHTNQETLGVIFDTLKEHEST